MSNTLRRNSMTNVIRWHQVTFKESNDKILPNLDELHQTIRRTASDINARIITLQNLVESDAKHEQIQTLNNLQNCVQSAASVVSSASTTLGLDDSEAYSVAYGSEFGDCFPSQPSETVLRWIAINTFDEFEEDLHQEAATQIGRNRTEKPTQQDSDQSDSDSNDHSDSDNELEITKVQALLQQGREKFNYEDFEAAERLFRNGLSRTTSSLVLPSSHRASRLEIMDLLVDTYMRQAKWSEAQPLLIEEVALRSRGSTGDNGEVLSDIITLTHALLNQSAHAEALLYARRAHKGYRRMATLASMA